jgi:hypothetical protein
VNIRWDLRGLFFPEAVCAFVAANPLKERALSIECFFGVESPNGLERHSCTSIYSSDKSMEKASGAAEKILRGAKTGAPRPSAALAVAVIECYGDVSQIDISEC